MKTIINGKRYDTETATKIARWHNGYGCTDFNWCEETLYRTPKGVWFLHGEGGALSGYSESYGNCRGGGSAIQPMSDQEAKEWLEKNEKTEALEAHFADQIQDA